MIQALCIKPFCFRKAVVETPGFHKCYKIVGLCQFLQSRDEGPSDPHHKEIALQPRGAGLIRQIAFLTSFLRQVSSALRPGDSGCHLAFVWLPGASPMAHLILTPKSTEIPSLLQLASHMANLRVGFPTSHPRGLDSGQRLGKSQLLHPPGTDSAFLGNMECHSGKPSVGP